MCSQNPAPSQDKKSLPPPTWKPNSSDLRADGSQKGTGFLGVLKRPGGGVSTELSIGVNIDGKETEIPALVPTLTKPEINHLLSGGKPTSGIVHKAMEHAKKRKKEGKGAFYEEGE